MSTGTDSLAIASATISGGQAPSGVAIFGYRKDGVLVSEAGVPASAPMLRGRIYAEIDGTVNTGFAIANPNDTAATISFHYTNASGANSAAGSVIIPAHGQISRFLDEAPFNVARPALGTFTFDSNVPVAAIALRGLVNERAEFLVTTLPIANPDQQGTATVVFPHIADGGGWTTQFVLVNPSDQAITGTLNFFEQGNGSSANALSLNINGASRSSIQYSIAARSSYRVVTSGGASQVRAGSAQVVPQGSVAPVGVAIFSFKKGGATVSEAGTPSMVAGKGFRMYAEASNGGSVRSGVAVQNSSANEAQVTLELTKLDGTSTGLTASVTIPGRGQRSFFLNELPGFQSLPMPFQGVLRISSGNQTDIAVLGLRGRNNERGDFLITTTPPTNENAAANTAIVFPHVVNGGGYTTQFITYGGTSSEPATGSLKLFSQAGGQADFSLR
jgi:hypothetical protein